MVIFNLTNSHHEDRRAGVVVHGCFWHGHKGCPVFKMPKTRTEFWREKIGKNRALDARQLAELQELGCNVVTIWECEISSLEKCKSLAKKLPYLIERRPMEYQLPCEDLDDLPMVADGC